MFRIQISKYAKIGSKWKKSCPFYDQFCTAKNSYDLYAATATGINRATKHAIPFSVLNWVYLVLVVAYSDSVLHT
jgi:hypothetical protein